MFRDEVNPGVSAFMTQMHTPGNIVLGCGVLRVCAPSCKAAGLLDGCVRTKVITDISNHQCAKNQSLGIHSYLNLVLHSNSVMPKLTQLVSIPELRVAPPKVQQVLNSSSTPPSPVAPLALIHHGSSHDPNVILYQTIRQIMPTKCKNRHT
jgi:hypothetical protein